MDTFEKTPPIDVLQRKRRELTAAAALVTPLCTTSSNVNVNTDTPDPDIQRVVGRKGRVVNTNFDTHSPHFLLGGQEMLRSASSPSRVGISTIPGTSGLRSSQRVNMLQRSRAFTQDTRARSPLSTVLATASSELIPSRKALDILAGGRSKSFTSYRSPKDEMRKSASVFAITRIPSSPVSPSPSSSPKMGLVEFDTSGSLRRSSSTTRRPSSLSLQLDPTTYPSQDEENNPFRTAATTATTATTSSSNESPSSDSTPAIEIKNNNINPLPLHTHASRRRLDPRHSRHRRRNSLGSALMRMQMDSMSDSDASESPAEFPRVTRLWSDWQLRSDEPVIDDDDMDGDEDEDEDDSNVPVTEIRHYRRNNSISWSSNGQKSNKNTSSVDIDMKPIVNREDTADASHHADTPVRRVSSRRTSLLPKSKPFQRVAAQLNEEVRPFEAEMRTEAEVQKALKSQDAAIIGKSDSEGATDEIKLDSNGSSNGLPTMTKSIKIPPMTPSTVGTSWNVFRDTLPSPTFYPSSRLNPEVDMNIRQEQLLIGSPSFGLAPSLFPNNSGLAMSTTSLPPASIGVVAVGRVVKRKYSSASQSSEASASGTGGGTSGGGPSTDRYDPYHSIQFKRRAVSPSVGSPILSGLPMHTATITPIGSPTSSVHRATSSRESNILQRPGTLLNIQDTNDGLNKMNLN